MANGLTLYKISGVNWGEFLKLQIISALPVRSAVENLNIESILNLMQTKDGQNDRIQNNGCHLYRPNYTVLHAESHSDFQNGFMAASMPDRNAGEYRKIPLEALRSELAPIRQLEASAAS